MIDILIPIRTVSGLNARESWHVRDRRVKIETITTTAMLEKHEKPALPILVTMTRIGPGNGLDPFDNLPSSFKGVVDAIARWLNVNDRNNSVVRYECKQERGKTWGVRVQIGPMP